RGNATITYSIVTVGCGSDYNVKSITIDTTIDMSITGDTLLCSGATTLYTATETDGVWRSLDTPYATVDETTGFVTAIAQGNARIQYSKTNSCGSFMGSQTLHVLSAPALTLIAGARALCIGNTGTLHNTITGGTWTSSNPAAITVDSTTGVARSVAIGTANITYTASNYCGTSTTFDTMQSMAAPTARITSAASPCGGNSIRVSFAGTAGATIRLLLNSSYLYDTTLVSGSYNLTTPSVTSTLQYKLQSVSNAGCTVNIDTTTTIYPGLINWVGGHTGNETNWYDPANWSCGAIPTVNDDIFVSAPILNQPAITTGVAYVRSMTLESTATLSISSGAVLHIKGNIKSGGTIAGAGTAVIDGVTAKK
ncbi:MAG: hypothetical protein EBX41_06985, partial [Chitinophagia bacterium]|nr:hypothetical protein [Chitinophagia bacterium]